MKMPPLLLIAALAAAGASTSFAAEAAENWAQHCARCHAKDGSGSTNVGKKLKLKDYRTAEFQAAVTDEEMLKAIVEGIKDDKGKQVMPAYPEKLSQEEMEAFIPFIRAMKS